MANQAYDICHTTAGWTAVCDDKQPNGPIALEQDGTTFLLNLTNQVDDTPLHVIKSRTYRKGGKAIHDNEARINDAGGTGFRQITRYANNVARINTDVMLKRDTKIKDAIQVGSFKLKGNWKRMLVIPQQGEPVWQDLTPGTITQNQIPLAWVFVREDGFKCEISAGFDLWRWNAAFAITQPEIVIQITEDQITFQRNLLKQQTEEKEPATPEPRDYRFCYQIAWTTPAVKQDPEPNPPPQITLENGQLPANAPNQLSLDFTQLVIPDSARTNGEQHQQACWESKTTVQAAKKIIRQLAANAKEGWLNITGGLTPTVCTHGKHVDRPQKKAAHWDLNGIICFAEWTRQTLGPQWKITFSPQGIWAELPSLQELFGLNGFTVE